MTTIHIMIDLETWGTEPGCDIRSIGACVFDPLTGYTAEPCGDENNDSKSFYIATMNPLVDPQNRHYGQPDAFYGFNEGVGEGLCRKYGLQRDPRTVQWWSEQTAEAQAAFADPVDLKDALKRFGVWLANFSQDGVIDTFRDQHIRIWSHGPSFDPPILAAAYKAVGLPVPWHYRAPRDTRTCFDMAGIEDHSAWLERYTTSTHHHALDDAICQAKAVCGAYMRLRDDTWEQAARICDDTTSFGLSPSKLEVAEGMQRHCAKAIRAQKSDSPQRAANQHGNHVYPLPK